MKTFSHGFSLLEMMIAVTLAGIVTAGTLSIFFSQNQTVNFDEIRAQNIALSESVFNDLSRLFRHAITETISIQYDDGQLNNGEIEISEDKITLDFALPSDYPIWPNDKTPYQQNWVRLQWSNSSTVDAPYQVGLATAISKDGLNSAIITPMANEEESLLISNIDFWPLDINGQPLNSPQAEAAGGYRLQISSRTSQADTRYVNPNFSPENWLSHYRTYSVSGIVSPRN